MTSAAVPSISGSLLRDNTLAKTGVIIPTYNAGRYWHKLYDSLAREGVEREQIMVIDSSSEDDTRDLVLRSGCCLKQIPKKNFRHGATRQIAAEAMSHAEYLVFLTQDALPCGDRPLAKLVEALEDSYVGAVYGRQLPRDQANAIEGHARLFNYPARTMTRDFESRRRLGLRAAFFSNSFAAFRQSALREVGGFPADAIVSEDVTVAARMLIAGWKIAYAAEATAIHSHPLTVAQEFRRYFDIGVHHGRADWLLKEFGTASGEGRTFVLSQMRFLLQKAPALLPEAIFRNASKWCSYQLGRHERYLPASLKTTFSGQPNFWRDERTGPAPNPSRVVHHRSS